MRPPGTSQLAAKAAFEAVHPPQAILTLLKTSLKGFLILIRDAPQVVFQAAMLPRPQHGVPLEQVGRHTVALQIVGCPI